MGVLFDAEPYVVSVWKFYNNNNYYYCWSTFVFGIAGY